MIEQIKLDIKTGLGVVAYFKSEMVRYIAAILVVNLVVPLGEVEILINDRYSLFPIIFAVLLLEKRQNVLEILCVTRRRLNFLTMFNVTIFAGAFSLAHILLRFIYRYLDASQLVGCWELLIEESFVYFIALNLAFAVACTLTTLVSAIKGEDISGANGKSGFYTMFLVTITTIVSLVPFRLAILLASTFGVYACIILLIIAPMAIWKFNYFLILKYEV